MPGKRKRSDNAINEAPSLGNLSFTYPRRLAKFTYVAAPNGTVKSLSAIAAARLKAAAALISNTDSLQETPPSPLVQSSVSETADPETEDDLLIPQNRKLSTWSSYGSNVLSDTANELSIVLEKHSTVSFVGCFDVKVLKGAVNINGANLAAAPRQEKARSHRVFAPTTHPITKIRGLDRTNQVQFLSCREPTPFAEINPLFSDIWSGNGEVGKGRSFAKVTDSDEDPLERPLVPDNAPEDWVRIVEDLATTASSKTKIAPRDVSKTLIIGPQFSGKSTFARRLLNRCLTGLGKTAKPTPAVCYLDLDPSKPEYTPHGQISLGIVRDLNLGPAFTHSTMIRGRRDANETIAAHVLPVQGFVNHEEYFVSCVEDLIQTYLNLRLDGLMPPLMINTPSFLYASHFPLLLRLLDTVKPDYVVHLRDMSSIDEDIAVKLHDLQTVAAKTNTELRELSAHAPIIPPARTDVELRAMQMQAYFHGTSLKQEASDDVTPQLAWTSHPLTIYTPWEFSYEETATHTQDIIGILPLLEPVDPSQLLTAINGTVIQIVSTSDSKLQAQFNELPRTPKSHVPYFAPDPATGMVQALSPLTTTYICTALVRGFDPEKRLIQVLVPETHDALLSRLEPARTVFVAGCCDAPEWAYAEDAYHQLSQRRRDAGERRRFVSDNMLTEGLNLPPWVAKKNIVDGMGYLNTARRVRKFLG
ncbi:Polynucleotide 5'-hydroxyl-kinase grc3 [Kalmusia sp. IMI 367209]|nr:Polynucleotide 5'-hydroxyl-kinase grc3 [Kalmusia sp. IMI 367209]